jgi:FAS-associated factor 2
MMASEGDFDLSGLSANQQEALQQYTDVTSAEIKDAIPLLERSQWNVQVSMPPPRPVLRANWCPDCDCEVL